METAGQAQNEEKKIDTETIQQSIESNNDLKSKKFIAYILSILIGLIGFIVIYTQTKDSTNFQKFLDFTLYTLIAYIGGNSVERISNKMGK